MYYLRRTYNVSSFIIMLECTYISYYIFDVVHQFFEFQLCLSLQEFITIVGIEEKYELTIVQHESM